MEKRMTANAEQAAHWNSGEEVGHWLKSQARYDQMLSVFSVMIFDAIRLEAGESLLDVGCGSGATTRAAAELVAPGTAFGVDLSEAMLERARADAEAAGITNISFEQADVQVHPFPAEIFDAVISRFGIMFFDDPVAAFANLRRATRPGGRLAFVCWQALGENEWLLVPGAAVAEHVPLPPPTAPGAPGMFAFANPDRPREVLETAGWRAVTVTSRHTPMLVGGGGTVDDAVQFLREGSIGRTLLANAAPAAASRALGAVRDALAAHVAPAGVQLDAAVWLCQATA
jgi:SAM-dependent methyltransferase